MKTIRNQVYVLPVLLACCISTCVGGQQTSNVRPAAVAGQFYPSDPAHLKLAVQQFLEDAVPSSVEKPVALVVPHAGYLFAGQIIADGFRQVKGRTYDTIVILGTNHTSGDLTGVSVYPRGAYRTPLGDAPIDEEIASALLKEDSDCTANTAAQVSEHSIEVQVPFVQTLFPSAKIVAAVVGMPEPKVCERFGKALAKVVGGKRVLIVASSDLSHFPRYEDAVDVDRQTLEAIAKLDPAQFASKANSLMSRRIPNLETCACGEGPILAAMTAAKALGATHGVVLSYANTADSVAEDKSRVVGYGAVVFAAGEGEPDIKALNRPAAPPSGPLQSADKKVLLKMARQSLQRFLTTETIPATRNLTPRLQFPQGVFVTLKQHGELRGCIGHLVGDFPVSLTTAWMAVQAGENDSRFPRVTLKELAGLEIEISVMTPMKPVAKPTDIVVGRDGVVISKNGLSAVFLPQVATEQGWGLGEMLDELCIKAGLRPGDWKTGAQFLVFQADVFSESQFK
jgi:hypothetical protein